MPRYIAFLRAINVGGHTVKMNRLCELFASFGFSNVETFIASGNVIFDSASKNTPALAKKIAAGLRTELGFDVATFIRTDADLVGVANYKAFLQADIDKATMFNVAFLAEPLDNESKRKLMALKTDIDDFAVHEREVYWLCLKKQSKSMFSNAVLEKTIGKQSTLRGINTIRKMVEKYT